MREEAKYLLAYSYIYQCRIFLLLDRDYTLRESENLPEKIASLTQEVKYSKVDPLSFKILIGISAAVAFFEGNPSITSFTV